MKKILSIISISLLLFISTINISFAIPTPQEVKNLATYEYELNKTSKGQSYIKAIDVFIKKNWNNRTYLQDMKTKTEKIINSNTIKDKFNKSVFQYLDAKIGITLQYPTTDVTTPSTNQTGSGTTNNTSTGAVTSTGTTSTGVIIEKAQNGIITKEQYEKLTQNTYFKGANNASFSFLEYSDLECPNCAKLHNDGIIEAINTQYSKLIDYRIMHFPLPSHQNAQLAAETAECLGSQKSYLFFNFINEVFKEQKFDKDSLISKAVQLGADKENLTQCVDTGFFREKVQNQKALAEALLGINSTPSVVIRNNFNGNFTILTGVHTLEEYQKALEGLYK